MVKLDASDTESAGAAAQQPDGGRRSAARSGAKGRGAARSAASGRVTRASFAPSQPVKEETHLEPAANALATATPSTASPTITQQEDVKPLVDASPSTTMSDPSPLTSITSSPTKTPSKRLQQQSHPSAPTPNLAGAMSFGTSRDDRVKAEDETPHENPSRALPGIGQPPHAQVTTAQAETAPMTPPPTAGKATDAPSNSASGGGGTGSADLPPGLEAKFVTEKRKRCVSSSSADPSSFTMAMRPDRKKPVSLSSIFEPVDSTGSAPANPLTAHVQPAQSFRAPPPPLRIETGQQGNAPPLMPSGLPLPTQATHAGTGATGAFGAPAMTGLASSGLGTGQSLLQTVPLQAAYGPPPGSSLPAVQSAVPGQSNIAGPPQWPRGQPMQPGWAGSNVALSSMAVSQTAPPAFDATSTAGIFALQQSQPHIMGSLLLSFVPLNPGIQTGVLHAAPSTQPYQSAVPQTAGLGVPGLTSAPWSAQQQSGPPHLPSEQQMLNNPAMLANPNLRPWNNIAAQRAASSQQAQGPANAMQGFFPSATGQPAHVQSSSALPQPTAQPSAAQSAQSSSAYNPSRDPFVQRLFGPVNEDNANNTT